MVTSVAINVIYSIVMVFEVCIKKCQVDQNHWIGIKI